MKKVQNRNGIRGQSKAFSLIEVVMALGICSFCLVALIGLLSQGLTTNRDTVSETEAAGIARSIAADLQMTKDNSGTWLTKSAQFQLPLPQIGSTTGPAVPALFFTESGVKAVEQRTAKYRVDITYGPSAASPIQVAVPVHITVTWPGGANQGSTVTKQTPGIFEAFTTTGISDL